MSCKRIYHLTIAYDPETEEVEYLVESIDESSDSEVMLLDVADFAEYFSSNEDSEEDVERILEAFCCGEPGEA